MSRPVQVVRARGLRYCSHLGAWTLSQPRQPLSVRAGAWTLLLAAGAIAVQRLAGGDFAWTVWGDRDLARSAVPLLDLPVTGAELSYGVGAGTPGGAFGYLLWIVGAVAPGPYAAWIAQIGLDTAAAALIGWSVGRRLGLWGAAVAVATWLSVAPNAMNQTQLWNPAWLSIFLALASVSWTRVIVARDTRAMAPWAFALALGAQMHVTAGVLALAMLPGILAARPPHLLRGLALAALATAAAYAPYLGSELIHGFPNTRLLMVPEQLEDLTTPLVAGTRPMQTLWSAVLTLGGGPMLDGAPHHWPHGLMTGLAIAGPALGAVGLGVAWRRERDPARRRLMMAVGLGVAVALASLIRSRAYLFQTSNTSRYLIFMTPLIVWLAALAADALIRALASRPGLRTAAMVVVLGSAGVRLAAFEANTRDIEYRPLSWTHMAEWTGRLQARGLLAEAPSNTTFLSVGKTLTREKAVPIESLRGDPDHEILPVAPNAPCRFVAVGDWPDPQIAGKLTVDALTQALAPDGPRVLDLSVEETSPGLAIGTWRPDVGPCPSNLTQRYLLTPDERITAARGPQLVPDQAVRLRDGSGDTRWLIAFDASHGTQRPTPVVYALLRLVRSGDEVEVALSSNQLRGIAWNGGFFDNHRVRHVRLSVTEPDGLTRELVLAPGVVGRTGVSAPLFARGLASSSARFTLRVDLQPGPLADEKVHDGPIVPLALDLPE